MLNDWGVENNVTPFVYEIPKVTRSHKHSLRAVLLLLKVLFVAGRGTPSDWDEAVYDIIYP